MKRRPAMFDLIHFMDEIGIRWHEDGVVKNGKDKIADYFKCDAISDEQKEKLNKKFGGWITFSKSQLQYAPEIIKPIILFLSTKEYQRRESHER